MVHYPVSLYPVIRPLAGGMVAEQCSGVPDNGVVLGGGYDNERSDICNCNYAHCPVLHCCYYSRGFDLLMPHKKSKPGYLSVTEALNIISKPFLLYWYGTKGIRECERIKNESMAIGTAVHEALHQRWLNKENVTGDSKVDGMVDRFFKEFVEKHDVEAIDLEPSEPLEDAKLKLQGTYDGLVKINDELYIGDWKTNKQLDLVSVPLQLSAYAYLAGKRDNVKITKGVVVRVDKDKPKVEVKFYEDIGLYWPYFKACLELARYVKEGI